MSFVARLLLALALAAPSGAAAQAPPTTAATTPGPPGAPGTTTPVGAPAALASAASTATADTPPPATVPPAPPMYQGPEPQVHAFQVALDYRLVYTRIRVEVTRLGETWNLTLVDDGSVLGDDPFDGVWSNRLVGAYARYATVRVYGTPTDGREELLYAGVVKSPDRHLNTGAWRVSGDRGRAKAERVAVAYPGGPDAVVEGAPVAIAFAWGGLVMIFVGALVRRAGS